MNMFFETLITLVIAIIIVGAVWMIYGKFVTPVKAGNGEKLYTIIYANGSAPDLSRTVDSMLWLLNSGRIDMEIVIVDGGLDDESRKIAELLANGYGPVKTCKASKLVEIFNDDTEELCPKRNMTK